MNDYAKNIKEKLDVVTVSRDDFNTVCKDRLDFGFDSIFFRYAIAQDELAVLRARVLGKDYESEKRRADNNKMHFYGVLEQLLHAHDEVNNK